MAQRSSSEGSFKVGTNFMEPYITGTIDIEKVAPTEDTTPIGATVAKESFTGVTQLSDVSADGPYDDTATTGPDAIFGAVGTTATVIVGYVGGQSPTKKTTMTLGFKSYKRTIAKGALTHFTSVMGNQGTTIVEA